MWVFLAVLAALACVALGWVLAIWLETRAVKRRFGARLTAAMERPHTVTLLPAQASSVNGRPSSRRPDVEQPRGRP